MLVAAGPRMIAWRLQEQAFGGLDRESLSFLDGLARHGGSPRRRLKPGTVLVRDYHRHRRVDVSAHGVDWRQRAEPRKYVRVANIPGKMMGSQPASAASACGRSRPWVSEITPMVRIMPDQATRGAACAGPADLIADLSKEPFSSSVEYHAITNPYCSWGFPPFHLASDIARLVPR